MSRRVSAVTAVLLAAACTVLGAVELPSATAASTGKYAPLDRPGPALSVPHAQARRGADSATGRCAARRSEPVLLNPATGVTRDAELLVELRARVHRAAPAVVRGARCRTARSATSRPPASTSSTRSGRCTRRAGERIAVMGHSQGGMSMRWALRFWPDTRAMVDDVIGMAGSNHGTTVRTVCVPEPDQVPAGRLAAGERPRTSSPRSTAVPRPSAASPTPRSSRTPTRSCSRTRPTRPRRRRCTPARAHHQRLDAGHLPGRRHTSTSTSARSTPSAYALVMDALDHAGPAKPARIDPAVCQQRLPARRRPEQCRACTSRSSKARRASSRSGRRS